MNVNASISTSIIENIIKDIKSITDEHYILKDYFNDITNKELEDIMNYYLFYFKDNIKYEKIDFNTINQITSIFDYNYNVSNKNDRITNSNIMEEAEIISDDLLKKVTNYNDRSINLPINLDNLIKYSMSSFINNDNINLVIYWIILKYSIIYYLYKSTK
ncbi:MAG: hypothetical protein IKH54_03980 [Bacilli bacterium]|nr:hypothetical protein [Bacilli bacterium]